MSQFWVTHPWLTIGGITTLLAGRTYMFIDEGRQRRLAAQKSPPPVPVSSGTPIAELRVWRRVVRGAGVTAVFPGGFSILLLLIWMFGGRYQRDRGLPIDFSELTILYFIGCVLLGAVIGFGAPYMRGFVRSSLIGTIAIAPLMIACGLSMDSGHWQTVNTVMTASLSVMFGMAIGHGAAKGQRRASEARDGSTLRQ